VEIKCNPVKVVAAHVIEDGQIYWKVIEKENHNYNVIAKYKRKVTLHGK